MYKNFYVFSEEIYWVNQEEGYCTIAGKGKKIYASEDVLQELRRDQYREEKRNKRYYTNTSSYNNEDDNGITFLEHLPDPSLVTPDIYVENKAVSELIKKALNTISEKQQKILLLYYIERYNEKEIANMIGLSQQAVNFNRHSALKKLAQNEQLKYLYENDF